MNSDVLWDRFAGCLAEYVDNYLIKTQGGGKFRIEPSYDVDYEIANPEKLFEDMSLDGYWVHKVARCRDINDLEPQLKELALQYLPKFFNAFPEYAAEECLRVDQSSQEHLRFCAHSGGNTMIINQYDTVLLKDGQEACIVEKFSERDFLADIGSSPKDWDTISITIDDIEKVLYRQQT